jgi:3-phosphoglycerate kinase
MNKLTIKDIPVSGKRVIIRADFNVPQDESGRITDDSRIVKSLDTVRYCIQAGAKVILMSHLGRPKGKPAPKYSMKPVADCLTGLLGQTVALLPDCVGPTVEERIRTMKDREVVLLENLRFHAEEEKNDREFSKSLAALADIYCNDAFGTAHRAHASTAGIAEFLPAVAGFLLAKEVEYFSKAITSPERPFVTILGGAKVSDKIKLIGNLLEKADTILIGGAMAYTFYRVMGIKIGGSKFDPEGEGVAREALEKSKAKNVPMIFPTDRVIAEKLEKGVATKIVTGDIPDGWSGFDIGPATCEQFKNILKTAKTVVWNGPLGVFEYPPFDQGTRMIADYLAEVPATTIIGGGDTAAAIREFGLEDKMSHVSTGGGASLEFLEGTVLPGVAALKDKK